MSTNTRPVAGARAVRVAALAAVAIAASAVPARAGDVRARQRADTLTLRGTGADDRVVILRGDQGGLRIGGQDGTTVDGSAEPVVFTGVTRLKIATRGGDDVVSVGDVDLSELRVATGGGADTIELAGTTVSGRTLVNGGGGERTFDEEDRLRVDGATLGDLRAKRVHVVALERRIGSDRFAIELEFVGELELTDGRRPWTDDEAAPYVAAAGRWTSFLEGAGTLSSHTLRITFFARKLQRGVLGAAAPTNAVRDGDDAFPTSGVVGISAFIYSDEARAEFGDLYDAEFAANIEHEIGHVLGIGSLFNLRERRGELVPASVRRANARRFVEPSRAHDGWVYREPAGLAAYNAVFGTTLDVVPIQNGGGHFWIPTRRVGSRETRDGSPIPSPDAELMAPAGGRALTALSLGVLADLGWVVDPAGADAYPDLPATKTAPLRSRPRCACAVDGAPLDRR